MTPPKKIKPACSYTHDVMPLDTRLMPDGGWSEWVPTVADGPGCDEDEVAYHTYAVDPPASAGLAAPGPPTPALLLSPPRKMEEYEVEYTPLEPLPCAMVQTPPSAEWGVLMHSPVGPHPEWSEVLPPPPPFLPAPSPECK